MVRTIGTTFDGSSHPNHTRRFQPSEPQSEPPLMVPIHLWWSTVSVARSVEMRITVIEAACSIPGQASWAFAGRLLPISTRISDQYVVGVPVSVAYLIYQPLLATGDRLWCVGDISLWPHAFSVCDLRSTRLPNFLQPLGCRLRTTFKPFLNHLKIT